MKPTKIKLELTQEQVNILYIALGEWINWNEPKQEQVDLYNVFYNLMS